MTDNSKSSSTNATMPKDIPQPPRAMAQALSNNSPTSGRRNSFFEWAFGGFSPTSPTLSGSSPGSLPTNSSNSINPNNYEHHRSNSVAEEVAARNAAAIPRRKPRALSQTFISHDEALNLSRAGFLNRSASTSGGSPRNSMSSPSTSSSSASAAAASSNGPSSPPVSSQQPRMQRKRQNSHYENIGVVAAFSGGPSSF